MHINCIGKRCKFYSVLTVIDALLTKAFHTTYTQLPVPTTTSKLFILHYLVISSQPIKHRPPCLAYTLHWKKGEILKRTDGHQRLTDQSLSHHIYNRTFTYQNTQPLYIALLIYL